MEKQGKIWGSTISIFNKNNVEIHRIVGKKGGYSSTHLHKHKYNLFFVEFGKIKINIRKDYGLVDSTILGPQESCTVDPNEFHSFEILEDGTVVYEVYYVTIDGKDIVRENHGGLNEDKTII